MQLYKKTKKKETHIEISNVLAMHLSSQTYIPPFLCIFFFFLLEGVFLSSRFKIDEYAFSYVRVRGTLLPFVQFFSLSLFKICSPSRENYRATPPLMVACIGDCDAGDLLAGLRSVRGKA